MNDKLAFLHTMGDRRKVDRILIVTDDVPVYQSRLQKYFDYSTGTLFVETEQTMPDYLMDGQSVKFTNYRINIPLTDDRELSIVQPVEGNTPYRRYLDQYGKGVMGLRELVSEEQWNAWKQQVADAGLTVAATLGDYGMTIDLRSELGCFLEVLREDRADEKKISNRRVAQVCITTDDIHKAAENLTYLLGVGPWEIGHICTRSADYLETEEYPADQFPKTDFLTGIGFYG